MNNIDKKFYEFVDKIKTKSINELYNDIRQSYEHVSFNIKKSLEEYFVKFPYWGQLNEEQGIYEELYNRAESLNDHIEDFFWLYDHMEDYRSKKTLYAILNNWYEFDFITLSECIETNYKHYFDLDLIKCNKHEVFVDLGAYIGDTIIDYIKEYGINNYKKIYCYETTPESCYILKKNLEFYPNIVINGKAVLDKPSKVYLNKCDASPSANTVTKEGNIEVEATSLDLDIKEKITMIKMDIEGSEQDALKGCKKHIQKSHPKLLISVYHNHEDLWKIPIMIEEMSDKYKFYLRYYGNNIFPTEIVLIAV